MQYALAMLALRVLAYCLMSLGFIEGDGVNAILADPYLLLVVTAAIAVGGVEFVAYLRKEFGDQIADLVDRFLNYDDKRPPDA